MSTADCDDRTDRIYQHKMDIIEPFKFDDSVADVFSDMIQRSIPGYDTIVDLTGVIASRYIEQSDLIYELGCSLGATSQSVGKSVENMQCKIIGIDSSRAMIDRANLINQDSRISFIHADVLNFSFQPAKVFILNFLLQFITPAQRTTLLERIHHALKIGGVVILAEKIISTNEFSELHLEFKRQQGYSNLEIAQKRTALENVMQIDPLEIHLERLKKLNFIKPRVWFQCMNWISILANR